MTHATSGDAPVRVLIAEDEAHLGSILGEFLARRGMDVAVVRDGAEAAERLGAEPFDVALVDIVMPGLDGLDVLRRVREQPFPAEVVIITGNGTVETAIAALKLGAYDFLAKPYRMSEIETIVRRAAEKRSLARENARLATRLRRAERTPTFVTEYAPLRAVLSLVERVAPSGSPVLITGESGTGKDLVARLLHHWSGRASGPFVDVAAGSLGAPHGESELFGVERGAFPGADAQRLGLLELASGGTLYLDQVADLDPRLQAGLVRVLETGRISRVGGTQPTAVDVRVVASTAHDVGRAIAAGALREDFVHRINTIRIALPPLRERGADVQPLAEHFLREFGGGEPPALTPAALAALERYRWPGNVRELRNVLERAVLLCTRGVIDASDLPLGPEVGAGARATPTAPLSLEEVERRHIADVLERTGWHRARAAALLGIAPKTLYRKVREYGLAPSTPSAPDDPEEAA